MFTTGVFTHPSYLGPTVKSSPSRPKSCMSPGVYMSFTPYAVPSTSAITAVATLCAQMWRTKALRG